MIDNTILISNEETTTLTSNDSLKLYTNDSYNCPTCPYPIEILEINDIENTLTFKCLSPKEKQTEKTISISEYLDSMRKNTYLYSECSLCNKKQNKSKDTPIFSYCIKCDKIICFDCISKHLEINKKNHPNLNKEYIIKNNEKNIKCLLHPNEKNSAFCFKCNTHICNECKKSKMHKDHLKNDIIEVLVTDEVKNILNNIINIYKERINKLTEEKQKKEIELLNEKKDGKEKIEKRKKDKNKEIQKN